MRPSTDPRDRARSAPSTDTDIVLADLDRYKKGDAKDAPSEKLTLRDKSIEGRGFFDLRLRFRTASGEYAFLQKGVSIRRHEAPHLIAALWSALDAEGKAKVRALLAREQNGGASHAD